MTQNVEPVEWSNMIQFQLAPPPKEAPVHRQSEKLGINPSLKAEQSRSQFRCCECRKMQPVGSWLVWVPDGVRVGDPGWSVTEASRVGAYNEAGSGWCLSCARRLSRPSLMRWLFG